MSVPIVPTEHGPEQARWVLGTVELLASRSDGLWRLTRPWSRDSLVIEQLPALALRLGTGDAVAHLVEPVVLQPRQEVLLWVSWPLELVVLGGEHVIDQHRPGMRRTLLGSVEDGRVLPAARAASVAGPSHAASPSHAALRVELANRGATVVTLRRFPVAEGMLQLSRAGPCLAAGTVDIAVLDSIGAEAGVSALPALDGFQTVSSGTEAPRRPSGYRFGWLMDATRRSTEFQL